MVSLLRVLHILLQGTLQLSPTRPRRAHLLISIVRHLHKLPRQALEACLKLRGIHRPQRILGGAVKRVIQGTQPASLGGLHLSFVKISNLRALAYRPMTLNHHPSCGRTASTSMPVLVLPPLPFK
jgi:hypothetical protein